VAVVAWNRQAPEQLPPPFTAAKPQPEAMARKPAPADPRDTSRDRPERERTSRPGEKQ